MDFSMQTWILSQIYLKKWKSFDKLPSIGQLAIKFDQSETNVKKQLKHLKDYNLLQCKKRIGCFVDSKISKAIPFSMRIKYQLNFKKVTFSKANNLQMKIEYSLPKLHFACWSEIKMTHHLFVNYAYTGTKTFLDNLASNNIIVTKFTIKSQIIMISNVPYCLEIVTFFDNTGKLIAISKQYIPAQIWHDLKNINI